MSSATLDANTLSGTRKSSRLRHFLCFFYYRRTDKLAGNSTAYRPLANAQLPTKAFVQWFRLTAAGNLAACHSAFSSSSSSSSGSSGSVTYRTFGGEDLTAMSAPVLGAAAEMGMSVFTSLLRSVRHTAQCWPSAIHPKPAR